MDGPRHCHTEWRKSDEEKYHLYVELFKNDRHELIYKGFPGGSDSKVSAYNAVDLGSISGLGRSSGEGKGYAVQYSDLENALDYAHEVAKSQTWLSDFHFLQSL